MGGELIPQPQVEEKRRFWTFVGIGVAIVIIVVAAFGLQTWVSLHLLRQHGRLLLRLDAFEARAGDPAGQTTRQRGTADATVTYLDGKITNTGDKTVTRVLVQATFKNSLGQVVQRETLAINVLTTGGPYPDVVDLSAAPLAPGQTRPFRITVEGSISADWNHELPDLQFVQVVTR